MILYDFVFSEDRDRVAEQGLLAVKGAALNLKSWDTELTLSELIFKDCAFLGANPLASPELYEPERCHKTGEVYRKVHQGRYGDHGTTNQEVHEN